VERYRLETIHSLSLAIGGNKIGVTRRLAFLGGQHHHRGHQRPVYKDGEIGVSSLMKYLFQGIVLQ
jgi:hypothetical protein